MPGKKKAPAKKKAPVKKKKVNGVATIGLGREKPKRKRAS